MPAISSLTSWDAWIASAVSQWYGNSGVCMDTTCTSVPSASMSASRSSGVYRILGELIRMRLPLPTMNSCSPLRLVSHPVPVLAAGKGLPQDLRSQVGVNVDVSHESSSRTQACGAQ